MKFLLGSLLSLTVLALPHASLGTANGSDNAGNYAGQSTYIGTNGGSGFATAFYYTNPAGTPTGAFLGSSGQIDTAGLAFGLTNGTSGVSRMFGSGSTVDLLSAGQTFRLQLQAQSGSYSLNLNKYGTFGTYVALSASTASPDYQLILTDQTDPASQTTRTYDTGVPFNATALTFGVTPNSGSYTFTLTPAGGPTTTLTESSVGGAAQGFYLSVGTNSTLYYNNLTIVPEPKSTVALLVGLVGGVGGLLARRRFVR